MPSSLPTTLLLAALSFTAPSVAQNDTANATCPNQHYIDVVTNTSFNSTGSVAFRWPQHVAEIDNWGEWYYSVVVNDTVRGRSRPYSVSDDPVETQSFLSVRENVRNTSVCLWRFPPQNLTLAGDRSCGGVMNQTCMSYLQSALLGTTDSVEVGESCGTFPSTDKDILERYEACGENFPSLIPYTPIRQDVTDATCSFPSLQGVDIPDSYVTSRIGAVSSPYKDPYIDGNATEKYDLQVNQPVPLGIFVSLGDHRYDTFQRHAMIICVTPNNAQPGSRIPDSSTPWETSEETPGETPESSASWTRSTGRLRAAMAGVVGMMLAL